MAQLTEAAAFQRLAESDFRVFLLLWGQDRDSVPQCHPLHYFQMATEKLAKAAFLAMGTNLVSRRSHAAFLSLSSVMKRNDVARALGWKNFRQFSSLLNRLGPLINKVVELHPSIRDQGLAEEQTGSPNVEYPWLGRQADGETTWFAPCCHDFRVLAAMDSGNWAELIRLIKTMLNRFSSAFVKD